MEESIKQTHETSNGMRSISPGEVLLEEYMKPLGLSEVQLALRLNLSVEETKDILTARTPVGDRLANILSSTFDTTPGFWLNLEKDYRRARSSQTDV